MEKEAFLRRRIAFDRLESFGFRYVDEVYRYERLILPDMLAIVTIRKDGEVSGKVYDADSHEEYVNYRIEGVQGAYIIGVKNAYEALLSEIAESVSDPLCYASAQANRIDDHIREKYGAEPEFLWKKFPHFGVYRNALSRKWFAIIMNISKSKVVSGASGEADVMNLKVDDRSDEFIEKGAYPSYHMNPKSWITVILDGSLSDELVEEMIAISYDHSVKDKQRKKRPGKS